MAATGVPHLIPGTPAPATFPLTAFQSPRYAGVTRAIIESITQPGDLVLAVGVDAALPVAETLVSGRRMVALSRNPIHRLWAELDLHPVPVEQVQAALTQLGDLRKAGAPLISHINASYSSRCPRCRAIGTAEWFAWEREHARPFAKRVHCRRCGNAQEGPTDQEDLAAAGDYPPISGLAYHLALSRAAPSDDPDLERVAELVELYTSRNLASLMDVVTRLPQLHVAPDVRRALEALCLEALHRSSSLVPYETSSERPRSLRPPQRFLEMNVWTTLEEALNAYTGAYASGISPIAATDLAASWEVLLSSHAPAYLLLNRSLQEMNREQLATEVKAVLFEVRPPEASFWALSILWATWLWGPELPAGLRGFLSRRRLDWEWYRKSLAAAFHRLTPVIRAGAPVFVVTSGSEAAPVRAVVHSARQSGLHVDRWMACPPLGYRLLLTGSDRRSSRAGEGSFDAAAAYSDVLRRRGEPTHRRLLEGLGVLETEAAELPAPDTTTASDLQVAEGPYIWLRTAHRVDPPLADRVEAQTVELLADGGPWTTDDLIGTLYALFAGISSPDPELVNACISAYTTTEAPGTLSLRQEDEPGRRRAELQQMRAEVVTLGKRLGYDVGRRLGGDVVWKDGRREPYLFRCTTSALLGPHLLKAPPPCDGQRCLIVPGGRAALLALKLRRDPRLRELVHEQRWTFIKFRHLRRMVDEIRNHAELEAYLGLDPMVEQASAQLTLPGIEASRTET